MSSCNRDFNKTFKLLHEIPLIITYFIDVFNMTYVKNQLFTNWKRTQKKHVYKEKSETRRKMVIVRGTLI